MLVLIQFISPEIAEDFLLSDIQIKDMIDFTIKEITASFAREWEKTANQKLVTSRNEYVQSIIVVDEGYAQGAVLLRGWLPNAVEEGKDAFDIKIGLLNGPNAKTGKNGSRYNTVPFSQGTPGSLLENFNGGILPVEVYQIAKAKPVGQPLTKGELLAKFQELKTVSVGEVGAKNFKQYTHKTSIYEGITKNKDKVTGQVTYNSFRRVSSNSDANSWQHPGIEGHHLAEETLEHFNVPEQVGVAIDNYLKSIGW